MQQNTSTWSGNNAKLNLKAILSSYMDFLILNLPFASYVKSSSMWRIQIL